MKACLGGRKTSWYSQEWNFETYICISIHDLRDRVNVNFVLYRDIVKKVGEKEYTFHDLTERDEA